MTKIEQEFVYSYNLVKDYCKINFLKPNLVIGDESFYKLKSNPCLKDYNGPIPSTLIYLDSTNEVFISANMLGNWPNPTSAIKNRLFGFCHENAHSLIFQINNDFRCEALAKMKLRGGQRFEMAEAMIQFDEGMAEFIAIDVCLKSQDTGLINEAKEAKSSREVALNFWIESCDWHHKYGKSPFSDWKALTKHELKTDSGVSVILKYTLGYNFVSQLHDLNLVDLIKNPPLNLTELLTPGDYRERRSICDITSP